MATAFRRGLTGTKKYANILFGRVINADSKIQKPRFVAKLVYGCTAGAVVTWYIVKNNIAPQINIHHEASKVGRLQLLLFLTCVLHLVSSLVRLRYLFAMTVLVCCEKCFIWMTA